MSNFQHKFVYLNLFFNFLCYTGLIIGLIFGSLTDYFYIFLVYLIIGINEQAFFHRMLSHKSWDCPAWLKVVGIHMSTLSLLAPAAMWVAVHRKHHRYNDTEKDPHSPLYKSNIQIQFLSSLIPFDLRYSADIVKNKIAFFYTKYYLETIIFSWLILIIFLGPWRFFTIWLAGTGVVIITANAINTWHHSKIYWAGQYRFLQDKTDTSKNDLITGYLTFDGWHNNHHVSPGSFYYGKRWWELDLCGAYIWFLATLTGYKNSLRR